MVVESISENSLLVIRKMLHELFILGSQKKKEPYFEPWFNIYVLLRLIFFFPPLKASHPRVRGENLSKNKPIYDRIEILARKHHISPAQLALAWVLRQGDDVVPILGSCFDLFIKKLIQNFMVEDYPN